ncbi:MAG: DUF4058 family protein [Microcoleus sp.]
MGNSCIANFVKLDLQAVMNGIYDEAGYDLSIDYTQSPPLPVLNESDREWMRNLFQNIGIETGFL